MSARRKHLYFLSELSDYTMENNYPDVRGWKVKDSALRTIGEVQNLLVNKQRERVVYLDVEVDSSIIDAKHDPYGPALNSDLKEFVNAKGENHLIIPIGLVEINNSEKYVFTETIDHETFASTKRIREITQVDRNYENAVLDSYQRKNRNADTTTELGKKVQDENNPENKELLKNQDDDSRFYTRKEFDSNKTRNH